MFFYRRTELDCWDGATSCFRMTSTVPRAGSCCIAPLDVFNLLCGQHATCQAFKGHSVVSCRQSVQTCGGAAGSMLLESCLLHSQPRVHCLNCCAQTLPALVCTVTMGACVLFYGVFMGSSATFGGSPVLLFNSIIHHIIYRL